MIPIPRLLKKNANFRYLFSAGVLSQLGGFVTDTAVSLHLYRITNKEAFYLGIARGINVFAFFLGNIFGGAWGVQYRKKNILIFCEVIRIPITLTLLFVEKPLFIILATGAIGFFTGVFSPSKKSISNDVVEKNEIDMAQSLNSTSMAFIHLVAPMSAAILYDKVGFHNILYMDIASYAVGIFLLLKVSDQFIRKESTQVPGNFEKETSITLIKEGLAFAIKDRAIRSIYLNGVVSGAIVGSLISLLLPYVDIVYGNGEKTYGVLLSLFGLGGVFGGTLFLKLKSKFAYGKIIFSSHFLESLLLIIWLQVRSIYISSLLFFIWGIFVFTRLTAQFSFVSNRRPENLHTRLFSGIELSFMLPNVAGSILAGVLIKYHSAENILTIAGVLFILLTTVRFALKETESLLKEG